MKRITLTRTLSSRVESFSVWIRNVSTFEKILSLLVILFGIEDSKKDYVVLIRRLSELGRKSKTPFLIKYLKVCYLMIVNGVSGKQYLKIDGDPLVSIDKNGLPAIIPANLRRIINSREDWIEVQMLLSVFALYRVLQIPGKLKLNTITDPFTGVSEVVSEDLLTKAFRLLFPERNGNYLIYPTWRYVDLKSAGPNNPISALGMFIDAYYLSKNREVAFRVIKISYYLTNGSHFRGITYFMMCFTYITAGVGRPLSTDRKILIGKLSEKIEAAGKIRVFAITDGFTQNVLHPLHKSIFKEFERLPIDGTMNQERQVQRILANSFTNKPLFSYDLSAATDRLPIALQTQVMKRLVGVDLAQNGADLLTKRDWDYKGTSVRYSVGQPIGAYSSGASMNITHHLIVQMAHLQVEPNAQQRTESYSILGDDIVIFDRALAERYLQIMKDLGVTVNLGKSVVSENGTFEFAKRIGTGGIDISPLGAKALVIGVKYPKLFSVTLVDAITKIGYTPFEAREKLDGLCSAGFLPRSSIESYYVGLFGPGGICAERVSLMDYSKRLLSPYVRHTAVISKAMSDIYLALVEREVESIVSEIRCFKMKIPSIESLLRPPKDGPYDLRKFLIFFFSVTHPAIIYGGGSVGTLKRETNKPLWYQKIFEAYYDKLDDYLSAEGTYRALLEVGYPIVNLEFAPDKMQTQRKLIGTLGKIQRTIDREVRNRYKPRKAIPKSFSPLTLRPRIRF